MTIRCSLPARRPPAKRRDWAARDRRCAVSAVARMIGATIRCGWNLGLGRPVLPRSHQRRAMSIIWTIIIGFVAGVIAKLITPGDNEPSGFVLTTILGIVGAFVATYLGQAIGWYRADEGAGLIGAIVGAVIVLVILGLIAGRRH